MAAKKKKKVVRRIVHKKHKKKSNVKKTKVKILNNQNQQIEKKIENNDAADIENKNDYGSGEFGNVGNIEDRGEVIYGDEPRDNKLNQDVVVEDRVQEENLQENNIREDSIQESKAILNDKEFVIGKPQIELPPIPRVSPRMGRLRSEEHRSETRDEPSAREERDMPDIQKVSTKINKTIKPAISQFTGKKLMSEKDIAMDFAIKAHKKFDRLIKASILFGSQTSAKDNAMAGSDIDIIFIIDDAAIDWDLELVSWYREELGKIVSTQDYGKELHVNTVRLVTWWEDLIHGDPVVINILRYGEALIDSGGFFNPIKALLLSGKIRSTPEAVYAALQRSPWHLARSKNAQLGAIEGVYWAMIDASHAALITAGKLPPSPEHVPDMLREVFVDTGMLKMSFVKAVKELYGLHKAISHGNVSSIKGQEIDEWQNIAEKFLGEMTRIIDLMLEAKK